MQIFINFNNYCSKQYSVTHANKLTHTEKWKKNEEIFDLTHPEKSSFAYVNTREGGGVS